jgi:Mg-chelatase subunit ChlD
MAQSVALLTGIAAAFAACSNDDAGDADATTAGGAAGASGATARSVIASSAGTTFLTLAHAAGARSGSTGSGAGSGGAASGIAGGDANSSQGANGGATIGSSGAAVGGQAGTPWSANSGGTTALTVPVAGVTANAGASNGGASNATGSAPSTAGSSNGTAIAGASNAGASKGGASNGTSNSSAMGGASGASSLGSTLAGAAGAASSYATSGAAGVSLAGTAGFGSAVGAAGAPNPPTCESEARQAVTLNGARLVIMLDKSGSMGDDAVAGVYNAALRWDPVREGLIDFFTSGNRSAQASLEIFPAPGDKTATCHADYATPKVAMQSLNAPQPLVSAVSTVLPSGGTPMLPAVMGAIDYAKSIEASDPFGGAVVVLITDGEPGIYNSTTGTVDTDCAPVGSTLTNTIDDIALVTGAAYSASPSIRTYVIGVGQSLTTLSSIASAGGTVMIHASEVDPMQARLDVGNALGTIANELASCSLAYPASVQGFPAERHLINLDLQDGNQTTNLGQSSTCNEAGWFYDNPLEPKRLILCPSTCEAVLAGASVSIVLGCPTRVID